MGIPLSATGGWGAGTVGGGGGGAAALGRPSYWLTGMDFTLECVLFIIYKEGLTWLFHWE